jgi:hypothetical protein
MRDRMVENASRRRDERTSLSSVYAQGVINPIYDDLVVMQNGWKVTQLATTSPRALSGKLIGRGRALLQRSLHPLPAAQTEFNLAVNRIVSHLLTVTARQAATIEQLEAQVAALSARSDRD